MANRYIDTHTVRQGVTGSSYYVNAVYPDIPVQDSDYYVITTLEDRLDLLAYSFYNDSSLWWIIASANALPGDSIHPPVGTQLRIPLNVQTIVSNYKRINLSI